MNEQTARRKFRVRITLTHGDWHAHCLHCGWHSVNTSRSDMASIAAAHKTQHVRDLLEGLIA